MLSFEDCFQCLHSNLEDSYPGHITIITTTLTGLHSNLEDSYRAEFISDTTAHTPFTFQFGRFLS